MTQVESTFQPFDFKVLWSRPQSSSLRAGCQNQAGSPSVSLLFQGLRRKYPASTATSPRRSDRSRHLERSRSPLTQHAARLSLLIPVFTSSETYPASAGCVLLSSRRFCCCRWDPAALSIRSTDNFMTPKNKTHVHYCVVVCLQTGTVVFALHKALPLSEPLHADAQDDRGSLLRLELFVQLRARQQANAFLMQHNARRQHSCRLHGPTLMKVSISIFLRLARASISTWQMAHM